MYSYKKGEIIKGKVTGIEKYGFFVSVDDSVNGLVHISEISDSFVNNIYYYVDVGEIIKAKVLEYDEINNKLKLSIKDIDYRIIQKKHKGIEETKSGFSKLNQELENWIRDKEDKI